MSHTHQIMDSTSVAGTIGGTVFTLASIGTEDYAKTAVLAALGAIVSFFVTLMMKQVWKFALKPALTSAWKYVSGK